MPWSFYSPATRAHALELLLTSDEGLYPGLVPHAFKAIGLHSQVKLHCRVKMFKMFMMMLVMMFVAMCLCDVLLLTIIIELYV